MNLTPLIASFLIVGLAELGDKSQLLTLALAAKYPTEKVIYGIFSATAALMLIAVLLGGIIQRIVPMIFISILSGAFFIIYGLIIIAPIKKEAGEEKKESEKVIRSKDPFWIVFGSFFLAEIGDKTQLATFAMAAKYSTPVQIWIGATLGMVLVNLFGIVIGNVLKNYLPEKIINYLSGGVFIVFGALTFLSILFKI
jgi:putative Ca2+/H+ antiporter (TMEM165/GDT1 family)